MQENVLKCWDRQGLHKQDPGFNEEFIPLSPSDYQVLIGTEIILPR